MHGLKEVEGGTRGWGVGETKALVWSLGAPGVADLIILARPACKFGCMCARARGHPPCPTTSLPSTPRAPHRATELRPFTGGFSPFSGLLSWQRPGQVGPTLFSAMAELVKMRDRTAHNARPERERGEVEKGRSEESAAGTKAAGL